MRRTVGQKVIVVNYGFPRTGGSRAAFLASGLPSQGEARKLLIAYGLGREVAGLVLDEPTNHLDLPSIERLEDALAEYPGALVLVTHDGGLARRVTSEAWRIEDGRVLQETVAGSSG